MAAPIKLRVAAVGDGAVGKTAILHRYRDPDGEFITDPTKYVPTVFEEFKTSKTTKKGKEVELTLMDSAGQEDLRELMKFSFNDTDVFILCFSCVEPNSFNNIKLSWMELLKSTSWTKEKSALNKKEIVLVMTKTDLLEDQKALELLQAQDPKKKPIRLEQGESLAKEIGAFKFVCCSSLRNEGIQDVFDAVLEAADKGLKSNWCTFI